MRAANADRPGPCVADILNGRPKPRRADPFCPCAQPSLRRIEYLGTYGQRALQTVARDLPTEEKARIRKICTLPQ